MSKIDAGNRAAFFPNTKNAQAEKTQQALKAQALKRNTPEKADEIKSRTSDHASVSIPEGIKDFSRIKKAVEAAPDIDNSAKIADLKARIQAGTYEVDYDAIADKMLASEY